MSVITVSRLATPDEISAEMDRRGEVIERLEADLKAMTDRAMSKWQPIETAPKDGTYILLGYFLETGGGGRPIVAFWYDTKNSWANQAGLHKAAGPFAPTHWQPLPTPQEEA